jgi:hypothetical protein
MVFFFDFIMPHEHGSILVHELGAISIDFNGCVLWSVSSTDIVENFRIGIDNVLELDIVGSNKQFCIDLVDGGVVKVKND